MAFGITRKELQEWKKRAQNGEIALITHFWYDERFKEYYTVTKAASSDKQKLIEWGNSYGLKEEWIHDRKDFPHFDLFGDIQKHILTQENEIEQLLKLERRRNKVNENGTSTKNN